VANGDRKMTNYRRYLINGGTYFFTVNLAQRNQCLLTDHINILRNAFKTVKVLHPFIIDAIVVLPEHLHTLWTLPEGDKDFSLRWRQIKSAFSRGLEKQEYISDSRLRKQERGLWQRRFWEHAIRDQDDLNQHIDYIHINPVKHGYVQKAVDWPYSSFHRYVQLGILPSDWAGDKNHELNLD
jgi:putative transposase